MTRIVVLGGGGGVGGVAVRALAAVPEVDEVVVADLQEGAARALADELTAGGRAGVSATGVDCTDPASLAAVIAGADVVVGCVGPFYRFGAPIVQAAIEAGIDVVDVCDDLDATQAQLELDPLARERGVTALIGMGNSPGLANVLTRYAADHLLDTLTGVDIMHIHGGEPDEGGAVIKHRIHAMTNDVPVFVDGEMRQVRLLEDSGAEFVVDTDFRDVGTYPVYPYPHPETITLPRTFPDLQRATNRGVVFPLSYFELTMDMVRVGTCTEDPLTVQGRPVVPIEFAVAHILRERPRLLTEAGVTGPGGCLKIVVDGTKDGADHRFVFSVSSTADGAGAGTGIPAALGAVLLARGQVAGPGVVPPEAGVDPLDLLALAPGVIEALGVSGGSGGSGVPIHIEHLLPDGTSEELELAL